MRPARPCRSASPVVRRFFEIVDEAKATRNAIAERVGIHEHAITNWRTGYSSPVIANFESALEVLGYRLVIVRNDELDSDEAGRKD